MNETQLLQMARATGFTNDDLALGVARVANNEIRKLIAERDQLRTRLNLLSGMVDGTVQK